MRVAVIVLRRDETTQACVRPTAASDLTSMPIAASASTETVTPTNML